MMKRTLDVCVWRCIEVWEALERWRVGMVTHSSKFDEIVC